IVDLAERDAGRHGDPAGGEAGVADFEQGLFGRRQDRCSRRRVDSHQFRHSCVRSIDREIIGPLWARTQEGLEIRQEEARKTFSAAAARRRCGEWRAPVLDFMWGYVMGQNAATQAAAFARAAGTADAMESRMRLIDVDERIDRLVLLVEAMWSLMREQGFSDEDLAARLMELDA